jgi:hypothetical protein
MTSKWPNTFQEKKRKNRCICDLININQNTMIFNQIKAYHSGPFPLLKKILYKNDISIEYKFT